jgi:hypothetical protein
MKTKIQGGLLFVISLLGTGIGWYFGDPESYGVCQLNDVSCGNFYAHTLGAPVFFLSFAILITSVLLFFVREEVYKSWRRFAYWAIPIGILILIAAPTSTPGGFGPSMLDFTKQIASWLVSGAFLLISLWIIVSRSLRPASK